ncbi:MAG: DNA-protecting protein DprA [Erysipelothrix sp.]|nr:DNA-protecting protein DprA [Erysipelothrix sp.]
MRNYIKNIAIHCKGDYDSINKMFEKRMLVPEYKSNYPYVVIGDDLYPKRLYDLEKPPYVLFYTGNIDLLKLESISLVGSRKPSIYAYEQTARYVDKLKKEYVIVSGLAKGIDTVAHTTALDFSTIAVLGCGIDVVYPLQNKALFEKMRQNHLILSEYPETVKPQKHFFPFRNRIIAALSDSIYVMSATLRSGTMTTVNAALSINRHVLCLPHRVDDPSGKGCNRLILEGADILTSVHDI